MTFDYAAPPDDNTDYARARHWIVDWTCRCGTMASISSAGRYVTQTCRKCGVKWEISPSFHDTTVHEIATKSEPTTCGSADGMIEPRPADGRRLENRILAIEKHLENWGPVYGHLPDLIKQVESIEAQVNGIDHHSIPGIHSDLAKLSSLIATVEQQGRELAEVRERYKAHFHDMNEDSGTTTKPISFMATDPIPDNPVTEDWMSDLANQVAGIKFHLEEQGLLPIPNSTQPNPTAMRVDANGDRIWGDRADVGESERWKAVASAMAHALNTSSYPVDAHGVGFDMHAAKAAVQEAIRQNLAAKPIDPEDEGLVQVVVKSLTPYLMSLTDESVARQILRDIAAAQREGM